MLSFAIAERAAPNGRRGARRLAAGPFRFVTGGSLWIAVRAGPVLLLVAGCAHYAAHPLSPLETAAAADARSLADPGLHSLLEANLPEPVAWPLRVWDLDRLVLAAFYFRSDIKVARAQWGVAQAGQVTAGQRPNPTIGFSPAYNATTAMASPWLVTATLDVPIETAGKRHYRQVLAARGAQVAGLRVLAEAWQVRADVRRALVALVAARGSLSLDHARGRLWAAQVALLESQHDAGAVSAFEVMRARIAASNARLSVSESLRAVAVTRVVLAGAVGVPARAFDALEISSAGLGRPLDESFLELARRRALLERPDILGALAEYAAREAALQLEIAKQVPDVHFNPGYEFDQGDNKWAVGLSIELPLLNRNQGPIAEAEARRAESSARFEALQSAVLVEVERSVAGFRAARQQLVEADVLLAELQRQEEIAQARLDAGAISLFEWIGLRLRQTASERARLDVVGRLQQARGDLESALQSPEVLPAALAEWLARPIARSSGAD